MNSPLRARLHQLEAHHIQTQPIAPIAVGIFPQTQEQAIARHLHATGKQATHAIIIHRVCARLPPDGPRKPE